MLNFYGMMIEKNKSELMYIFKDVTSIIQFYFQESEVFNVFHDTLWQERYSS